MKSPLSVGFSRLGKPHVLALAVADQHDPLGQVAPRLNRSAHDLLKGV